MSEHTSSNDPANLYEQGGDVDTEWARLKALAYPTECSLAVIGDVAGCSVLDVGAGVSTLLGDKVKAAGGLYTAVDVSPEAVAAQQAHGHEAHVGRINELGFDDGSFDTTHARFVLPHLANAQQRVGAIRELVRVSNTYVILMDYVGHSVGGTLALDQWHETLTMIAERPDIPFEPFYESFIEDEAKEAVGDTATISSQQFERAAGNYYEEIIRGGETLMARIVKGVPELAQQVQKANEALKDEAQNRPVDFTPPAFIAVTITKS